MVVNSVAHRDYSILGTDIQVKIFDDHLTVESPGILPGLVRTTNIREMHFSRNPKIARYMHVYKLVKEFGEGVDRMFREMAAAGQPEPRYQAVEFMVKATIWQHEVVGNGYDGYDSGYDNGYDGYELSARQKLVITALKANPRVSLPELAKQCGAGKTTIQRDMDDLKARCIVERDGSSKSGVWIVKV